MNVLDLFSGIGGFSLGLERAGMRTVAFCEQDEYCQAVLRKHWPGVPIYDDVRELTGERLKADGIVADIVTGGFPCQDVSQAGRKEGIRGARSGLWADLRRIIGDVRPRYAIVENVSALLADGMGVVIGDLAEIGFDAEWHCIPASAVGAVHFRDRVWIVAYPNEMGGKISNQPEPRRSLSWDWVDRVEPFWRRSEPHLVRMGDGFPDDVDRIGRIGNAVVPQIPEMIGRAIMEAA